MSIPPSILVVDDEDVMRESCREILSREGYLVSVAPDGYEGLEMLRQEAFDIVILDLMIPGLSGMEVLEKIRSDNPSAVVVIITAYATIESAVEAIKRGAYDYISKPFTPDRLRAIVSRGLERKRLILENMCMTEELRTSIGDVILIGESPPMREIDRLIHKVGPTDSTVLIYGESGTGKELVARAVHENSSRRDKAFVVVDCGSLVENLFESELFGHVKGSFTGATETKYGRFELANGGTIFFDEVGNISVGVQTRLLRAIQEREIVKVGSTQVVKIDVRIIAATNKNLMEAIRDGSFREDLFYRLSVVPIELPPLRERREDIPCLANHFLRKFSKERKKGSLRMSKAAMECLLQYRWPGNVRELENVIERAVVLADGDVIGPKDVSAFSGVPSAHARGSHEDESLEAIEREHIRRTLEGCNGHKGKTAEVLGIDRKTLRTKLKNYGILS